MENNQEKVFQTDSKKLSSAGKKNKYKFPCTKCGRYINNAKEICSDCSSKKCEFPGCEKVFRVQTLIIRPLCNEHSRIKFNQSLVRNGKWIGPKTIEEYEKIKPKNNWYE